MAPRKRKPVDSESEPEASEDFVPSAEASESSDFEAEESPAPKKKAPAKKRAPPKPKAKATKEASDGEEAEEKPKKKRGKAAPKITEPTAVGNGWTLHPPSLIYKADPRAQGGSSIACFDLDGTLIGLKSGGASKFGPKDADDWKWFSKEVPKVLRQLHEEGYQILVISNQGTIKSALAGAASEKARGRVDNMLAALNKKGEEVPLQVLMATQKDELRKPEPGMWGFFVQHLNKGVQPDLSESFYVGDMAGRPTDVGDGAASDKEFASRVGIKFFLPEDKFGEGDIKKEFSPSGGSSGKNSAMAAAFHKLADLVSSEPFKANAFRKVAKIIDSFPETITAAADLKAVAGVGKSSLAKVTEFLQTGTLAALSEVGIAAPDNKAAEVGLKFL